MHHIPFKKIDFLAYCKNGPLSQWSRSFLFGKRGCCFLKTPLEIVMAWQTGDFIKITKKCVIQQHFSYVCFWVTRQRCVMHPWCMTVDIVFYLYDCCNCFGITRYLTWLPLSLSVLWELLRRGATTICNTNSNSSGLSHPWWQLFPVKLAILVLMTAPMGVPHPQQHFWLVCLLLEVTRQLFRWLCMPQCSTVIILKLKTHF